MLAALPRGDQTLGPVCYVYNTQRCNSSSATGIIIIISTRGRGVSTCRPPSLYLYSPIMCICRRRRRRSRLCHPRSRLRLLQPRSICAPLFLATLIDDADRLRLMLLKVAIITIQSLWNLYHSGHKVQHCWQRTFVTTNYVTDLVRHGTSDASIVPRRRCRTKSIMYR